jgi:outer membrane protein assembly factor BamA
MLSRVLLAATLTACAALAQGRLTEVQVSGSARTTAAVLAASGLKLGQPVTPNDLDAACRRLVDSGFFRGASYRYQSKTAPGGVSYSVNFDLTDETTLVSVVLDIPNTDQDQLWTKFKAADPLLDRQMPDTDGAQHYYQQALEDLLAKSGNPQQLIAKREADLGKGKLVVVFRPANLPKLRQITFEGNHVFDAATLERVIHTVAVGQDYSDREFRVVVEANLTPMYEEKGYLKAVFPKIVAVPLSKDAVLAAVTIEEGHVWKLGDVQLMGDNLPAHQMLRAGKFRKGDIANWKQILISLDDMRQVLRADGYLSASAQPNRVFRDTTGDVDLRVDVQRGARFYFGSLELRGLSAKENNKAQEMWELRPGAPMEGPCLDEYVRSVFGIVRAKSNVNREMSVRQPGNLVDVVLKF